MFNQLAVQLLSSCYQPKGYGTLNGSRFDTCKNDLLGVRVWCTRFAQLPTRNVTAFFEEAESAVALTSGYG
jgi:hypothetical protein